MVRGAPNSLEGGKGRKARGDGDGALKSDA